MTGKKNNISAVILAGGQARRMGGQDKGLLELNGKAMIEYVIDALREQVETLLVNANRNIDKYARFGYPVVSDLDDGFKGPLAGMASCMRMIDTDFLLTLPCDSPLVPVDYASRMLRAQQENRAQICVADSGDRIQPVFCLLERKLQDSLVAYLDSGERKIDRWFEQHKLAKVYFSENREMFSNINTPEELKRMEDELAAGIT